MLGMLSTRAKRRFGIAAMVVVALTLGGCGREQRLNQASQTSTTLQQSTTLTTLQQSTTSTTQLVSSNLTEANVTKVEQQLRDIDAILADLDTELAQDS